MNVQYFYALKICIFQPVININVNYVNLILIFEQNKSQTTNNVLSEVIVFLVW